MKTKTKKACRVKNPWGIEAGSRSFWLNLPKTQQKDYKKLAKRVKIKAY